MAPLGEGEASQGPRPVKAMTTQEVAAYRPAQDPRYDPTEGRSRASALPSAGNDQIDNPLFEEQQQSEISSMAFDQGNDTPPVPFASNRQQEFYSSMYGSSLERRASSSSFSESSLSTLDPTPRQPSEYGMPANPTFSSHPVLGFQQPAAAAAAAPSVAAASLASFYKGPYFPRKSSLTASQQLAEDNSARPAAAEAPPVSLPSPPLSSSPLLGSSTADQPQLSPESVDADSTAVDIQSQPSTQLAQQHTTLNIPPPFSVSDESMSASTTEGESPKPTPAVSSCSPRSAAFDDGPTFAGSPLYSPPDNEEPPFTLEGAPTAQGGVPFSSDLQREPSYALAAVAGPTFHDNPVFSEVEPQPQASPAPVLYNSPPVSHTDERVAQEAPNAFQSTPMLGRLDSAEPTQQQPTLSDESMVSKAFDITEGPALISHSSPLSNTPVLGSSPPLSTPLISEPVTSPFQEPLGASQGPTLHSNPIFAEEPTPKQPQAFEAAADVPLTRESSVTLTEPDSAEYHPAYHSTPILGTEPAQPQGAATAQTTALPLHSEPSLALPQQLAPGELEPGYSNQPILGAAQQQQVVQPSPAAGLQSEPSLALPEQATAVEPEAVFSSQPIFGEARHWQQQQQQASVAAEEHQALSSQPIFGEALQQQQQLYTPSMVPADVQDETPDVYHSPRFQSRPVFESSAQQAHRAHTRTASADNPWADGMLETRPAYSADELPSQGITFHDNSLFDSAYQPQGVSLYSTSPLAASSQQQPSVTAQQPYSPSTPVNQGITYFDESPFDSTYTGHQQQQSFSPAFVPVSVFHVPAPSFTSQPTLGLPAPTGTAQPIPAQLDVAQRAQRSVSFSPISTFTPPGTPPLQSGGLTLYDTPPLGPSPSQVVTPVTTFTAEPTAVLEPLSDPFFDPTQRALAPAPVPGAVTRVPALLQPLDDPLYDPLERRPVIAPPTHPAKPSTLLQPLDDPLYDPTVQRPPQKASRAAHHGPRFVAAQNSRFPKQQSDPLYDPAAVETLPGLKDVTHRGEQVGTPTFAPHQQGPGAAPRQPPQGRPRPLSTNDYYSSRPILSGNRRSARTVNLTNIGRPAQAPTAPKPYTPVEPKEGYQLGGADVLPQDSHYVKPTPYAELGSHARSALSGAGWKTTWAMEMEDAQQQGKALLLLASTLIIVSLLQNVQEPRSSFLFCKMCDKG